MKLRHRFDLHLNDEVKFLWTDIAALYKYTRPAL